MALASFSGFRDPEPPGSILFFQEKIKSIYEGHKLLLPLLAGLHCEALKVRVRLRLICQPLSFPKVRQVSPPPALPQSPAPTSRSDPTLSQTHHSFPSPVFPTALEIEFRHVFCLLGLGRWAEVLMEEPLVFGGSWSLPSGR